MSIKEKIVSRIAQVIRLCFGDRVFNFLKWIYIKGGLTYLKGVRRVRWLNQTMMGRTFEHNLAICAIMKNESLYLRAM